MPTPSADAAIRRHPERRPSVQLGSSRFLRTGASRHVHRGTFCAEGPSAHLVTRFTEKWFRADWNFLDHHESYSSIKASKKRRNAAAQLDLRGAASGVRPFPVQERNMSSGAA